MLAELVNLAKMSHLIGCPKERTAHTQPIPWLLRLEAIELLFTLLTAWPRLCDSALDLQLSWFSFRLSSLDFVA